MIQLLKFEEPDIESVLGWKLTEIELNQFAGPIFHYPLTVDQITSYLQLPNQKVCKVIDGSKTLIGMCEFNFNHSFPRLSRIIIGDINSRGKGLGKLIVEEMVNILFEDFTVSKIDLNVFDWNIGAIKCYQKVGFKVSKSISKPFLFKSEKWERLNMTLTRESFIQ